uniref:AcidPPc domain-containing protein n=1 Tax=Ascaris lumbricoides TaxID=6252 RepID=A0A0M3HGH0_ASCLU
QVVEATLLKKKARYAGRASKCLNLDLCYAHRILSNRTTLKLVVAVCAERVMGIRHPFHTRAHWSRYCTAAIVFTIVLLAGMLTFYNNFSHICVVKEFCNRTQAIGNPFFFANQKPYVGSTNGLHIDQAYTAIKLP